MMTTSVACQTSFHVGQVTFLSSCCVSVKKFVNFCNLFSSRLLRVLIENLKKQAWQDSNLQHAVLETAALPIGATGLYTLELFFLNFTSNAFHTATAPSKTFTSSP